MHAGPTASDSVTGVENVENDVIVIASLVCPCAPGIAWCRLFVLPPFVVYVCALIATLAANIMLYMIARRSVKDSVATALLVYITIAPLMFSLSLLSPLYNG